MRSPSPRNQPDQRRRREREGDVHKDPWVNLVKMKADNPRIMAWRHRIRVQEEMLRMTHPQREHIDRVLESEQRRVRDDAKAILRFRHIAGMTTKLDVGWPPNNSVTVIMDGNGSSEETTSDEEGAWSPPPPYCRDGSPDGRRGPGDRDHQDRRGGREGRLRP